MTTDDPQKLLKKIILILASSMTDEEVVENQINELRTVYSNSFRHTYSEFFPIIVEIDKLEGDLNLEFLLNNLEVLKKLVKEKCIDPDDELLKLSINKLCDHLNLEIVRYHVYLANEERCNDIVSKIEETNQNADILKGEVEKTNKELLKANEKLRSVQTDLITVLSIFSAIVLSFSFGASSLNSLLNNLSEAPFLKTCFFVCLSGLVLINLLFVLVY